LEKLNLDRKSLRKFASTMCIGFLALAGLLIIRHKPSAAHILIIISTSFLFLGVICPIVLKPVYIFWMKLAFVLGWINTRLILVVIFYLVFTPMGVIMRIFGADLLDKKISKDKASYWKKNKVDVFSKANYERQF
jgi:hypothetical protein